MNMQYTANIMLIAIQKNHAWSHSFACWGLPFVVCIKALQVRTEQDDWASPEKICQIFSLRVNQLQPPKKQLRYPRNSGITTSEGNSVHTNHKLGGHKDCITAGLKGRDAVCWITPGKMLGQSSTHKQSNLMTNKIDFHLTIVPFVHHVKLTRKTFNYFLCTMTSLSNVISYYYSSYLKRQRIQVEYWLTSGKCVWTCFSFTQTSRGPKNINSFLFVFYTLQAA